MPVRIPPALAADLALLTDALDIPSTDIATTLSILTSDAAAAVSSYVGLSVRLRSAEAQVEFTTVEGASQIASITTSLRVPLGNEPLLSGGDVACTVLILYAARAGALVDLAADLAWLTGRTMDEVRLDEDVGGGVHVHPAESLRSQSVVNQAVGVLIGQGRTPDEGRAELDVRATDAGGSLYSAAEALLASLPRTEAPADG